MTYFLGGVLPYVAVLTLLLGVTVRFLSWSRLPRHLRWVLYPHPETPGGQARFMAAEILTFHSLFRRNRALWAGAFLFHLSLAASLVGLVLFGAGVTGPGILIAGLAGLLLFSAYLILFRLADPRARKISTPVEFLNLGLFLVLSAAGLLYAGGASAEPVRAWLGDLASFHSPAVPTGASFLVSLVFLEVFLIYFPFSRMIHMVSKWFAFHKVNWEHRSA